MINIMTKPKSLYDILEVSENASPEVVKAAYLSLVKKYHPDSNPAFKEEATKITSQLNQAYMILSDANKRQLYDEQLHKATASLAPHQKRTSTTQNSIKPFFSTFSDKCFVCAVSFLVIVTAISMILNYYSNSVDSVSTVAETTVSSPEPTVTPDGKHYHKIGPPDVYTDQK